jgi:hypothetical protein
MAVALTGIVGDLTNLLPSSNDLLQSLIAGAAGTVVLSGLKSGSGQDAIDPLHWFHHPASNTTGVVQGGQVMTMSKFMSLTPDQQKMIEAIGYTILPG